MVTVHRGPRWKVAVYGRDHGVPHFHIEGPEFRCSVAIATFEVIVGTAPASVLREVLAWASVKWGVVDADMAGVERMTVADRMRTIAAVEAVGPTTIALAWADGTSVDLDLRTAIDGHGFDALRFPIEFAKVEVGDWGHSLVWPSGAELGADRLWLETLSATGHDDVRAFLEWRLRHGLSLSKAAEALGVSRRMVAYYSNGEKKVPRPILLACRGWEVGGPLDRAA